ncbi:MAG: nucleotidyltransferase family protein [Oscillospiraceae bacterium]|nr:nucleotidyltransferase family protein [Oscillospiraceae bacterium]
MKAVVLAGGEGTRLKCITRERPKPLVPLLGRSIMEHILLLLRRSGFREVCAAVRYRAEDIVRAFGDGSALGISLLYRFEDEPLGTAGAVKNCADFTGDEDFLLISGDVACDFDLAALWRRHCESGVAATIALRRDSVPLRFGLAVCDGDDLVRGFVEKPDWERVVSDRVNTGVYVLSPRAMACVPEGQPFDFARDLFPLLLEKGERILGAETEGYWCDVGTPESYYRCCLDALEGKWKIDVPEAFRGTANPSSEAERPRRPENPRHSGDSAVLDFPCRDRAAAMGALSSLMLEMGADYSDGIRFPLAEGSVHICPRADRCALSVAVDAPDAEFASALALSAGEIIRALDL